MALQSHTLPFSLSKEGGQKDTGYLLRHSSHQPYCQHPFNTIWCSLQRCNSKCCPIEHPPIVYFIVCIVRLYR